MRSRNGRRDSPETARYVLAGICGTTMPGQRRSSARCHVRGANVRRLDEAAQSKVDRSSRMGRGGTENARGGTHPVGTAPLRDVLVPLGAPCGQGGLVTIEDIKARLAAATPGPWEMRPDGWQVTSAQCNICGTFHTHQMHDGGRLVSVRPVQPDADLIAHAPTDLARLVAVAEAAAELRGQRAIAPCILAADDEDVYCEAHDLAGYPCAAGRLVAALDALDGDR